MEKIVRRQAEAILSKDKLFTKDVFFSQKAQEAEQNKEKSVKAAELLNEFSEIVEGSDLGDDVLTSVCASTDTVQYYLEKDGYTFTIDFHFWKTSKAVQESLKKYMKSNGKDSFIG